MNETCMAAPSAAAGLRSGGKAPISAILPLLHQSFPEQRMPIYEYRCSACGHQLEALQKLSDSPLTDCPACGKAHLSKLVSAAGFQLKGSGWYATDFKNSGAKPAAKASGEGAPKADATKSEGAKSEAKAESKSEPASTSSASTGGGSNCSCH
jgi:putative FmdB family regulatory protein